MSDREASLQELLVASFQAQMNNVYTSIPCIVVAVRDGLNGQLVDIQPTINQKMKAGTTKERPVIMGVPVSFPVSETSGITFEINPGVTTGLAVFSMRNMDAWKAGNGKPSTPLNFGKMDKQDAVFYPGIQPPGNAVNNPAKHIWPHSTSDTVIFHNLGKGTETEIRLLKGGGIIINTNQDIEANCNNLTANVLTTTTLTTTDLIIEASASVDLTAATAIIDCPDTTWTGNITHTGDIVSIGNITNTGDIVNIGSLMSNTVTLDTHLHDDTMPMVNATSGPPAPGT